MLNESSWQSSVKENRAAWIIACICMATMLTLTSWPDILQLKPDTSISKNTAQEKAPLQAAIKKAPQNPASPTQAKPASRPAEKKRTAVKPAQSAGETSKLGAVSYFIQLGAFKKKAGARSLVETLKRHGWSATIESKPNQFLAVWAGPVKSHRQAEALRDKIHRKLKIKGFVVQKR